MLENLKVIEDDILVYTHCKAIPIEGYNEIYKHLKSKFPNNTVFVLEPGSTLDVLQRGQGVKSKRLSFRAKLKRR